MGVKPMPKFRRMKVDEFIRIKKMMELGLTNNQIGDITKRSLTTLTVIGASETYEDYKDATIVKPKAAVVEEDIIIPTLFASDPVVELLKSIDGNLKFLVEHMPIDTKKKVYKWF